MFCIYACDLDQLNFIKIESIYARLDTSGLQSENKKQSMSDSASKHTKKQQEPADLLNCDQCMKFFTTRSAYEVHLKMKHDDHQPKQASDDDEEEPSDEEEEGERVDTKNNSKRHSNKSQPVRSRMLQIQRNQLQDNIYTFLGELGEKHAQPPSNRADIMNFTNDQKLTGQTNYSVNKVIRTPYEEPIKCSNEVPVAQIEKSKFKQFQLILQSQLTKLQEKVEAQRQIWQLRDPMAPEEEVADQFSLMDIKKLIQNYPKRQIGLQYPHFSIFLVWIGRICKPPVFKEFFMILGEYMAEYYLIENHKVKGEQAYQNWKNFQKNFEAKKFDPERFASLRIFDEKNSKKLIEYFVQWADLFKALSI